MEMVVSEELSAACERKAILEICKDTFKLQEEVYSKT